MKIESFISGINVDTTPGHTHHAGLCTVVRLVTWRRHKLQSNNNLSYSMVS